MIVLRRPCTRLIEMSYEFSKTSVTRPALTNLTTLNSVNVFTGHTNKRFSSTHTVVSKSEDGPLKRFLKLLTSVNHTKTRLRVSSYLMYEIVADRINYNDIFAKLNMPNTFNTWFLITELHVWMLAVRAMAEGAEKGEDGKFIRNCIVEAMWADVNKRAKKLTAANSSEVRNQIQILSEQFQAALITYDEGLMFDDKALAGALWRRFFEKNCDNYVHLETMVKYVRLQTKLLDDLSRHDFAIKPNIQWININDL